MYMYVYVPSFSPPGSTVAMYPPSPPPPKVRDQLPLVHTIRGSGGWRGWRWWVHQASSD